MEKKEIEERKIYLLKYYAMNLMFLQEMYRGRIIWKEIYI